MDEIFKGLKVVELASVLAGPSVGMFLAELGAEVIKVENKRTGGDVTRSWKLGSEASEDDRSAYFCSVNWGKKSIALDLGDELDRGLLYRLLEDTDIVLSSFIPGKSHKMGVSAEQLLEQNPKLICGEINGYGARVEKAAFDAIIQAEAGFTLMNGLGENIYKMPVALMDVLAGHQLKEAILLAYIQRLKSGKGQAVSVSLLESGVASLVNQATNWLVAAVEPRAKGSDHPNIVPYGSIFQTLDKKRIILAIGNDGQFARLCELLDLELKEEWKSNPGRVANREAVKSSLADKLALHSREDLLHWFEERAIPAGGINSMKEVFELPQGREMLYSDGKLKGVRSAVFLKGKASKAALLPPPHYDEHGSEIKESLK
ncbi:MAG: CoA transferase [Bacteroidia bacterium]|nr:CoA transferase [Bacteroidia bacterium]